MNIDITPISALADEPVKITIRNLPGSNTIDLMASVQDEHGNFWRSKARFNPKHKTEINLDQHASIQGTYLGTDPSGLFWSMVPEFPRKCLTAFSPGSSDSLEITIEVKAGQKQESLKIKRLFREDSVICTKITEQDVSGYIYKKSGVITPATAILLIPGSSGLTSQKPLASLLASKGYVVLLMAYMQFQNLPDSVCEIPLERITHAIRFLKRMPEVDPESIFGYGISVGAEMMLAAASFLQIDLTGIIVNGPSSVCWQSRGPGRNQNRSSWSLDNQPIPFLKMKEERIFWSYFTSELMRKMRIEPYFPGFSSFTTLPAYEDALDQIAYTHEATIPVERIKAPILLFSGKNDQMEPCSRMGERICYRLRTLNFPFPFKHYSYPDTGHLIRIPYLPATNPFIRLGELLFSTGGESKSIAASSANAWEHTMNFLHSKGTQV